MKFKRFVFTVGLKTKDETSETTVRNLYCPLPFFMIPPATVNFVLCQIIKKTFKYYIQHRRLNLTLI